MITLSVSDGQFTTEHQFLLTVNAVNDPPTISGVANQTDHRERRQRGR